MPAAYGFVGVEAIEEDGSKKGVGVDPRLAETDAEVMSSLPLLQGAQVSLAYIIQAHRLADAAKMDAFFALVEASRAHELDLIPVPVLSADDGYFPNATNVEVYTGVVRELVAQWKARGLAPNMLVVDMEPPRDLVEALGSLDLLEAIPREHIDRERYARGVAAYTALVDELHAEGWKVAVTTQATLLADYADEDDDMRQYFSVVLDGPAWDQLDFQLYRSAYTAQVPGLTSFFVYDFAKLALQIFPGKDIGVGVGLTHPGPTFPETPTYDSSAALREDLQAAHAAGIPRERITVYNLKGVLHGTPVCEKVICNPEDYQYPAENDPAKWLIDVQSVSAPPEAAATAALKEQFELMDGLLDMSEDSQSGGVLDGDLLGG